MTTGFNVAEAGHVVNVLSPQSISGGKTGQRFSVKFAGHVSIIVQIGVIGAAVPTAILVKLCKDSSGTGATAIGFRYYKGKAGGVAIDQTSPPVVATASGITVIDNAPNQFIVIEIDAMEINATGDDSQTTDFPYVELSVTDSGNVTYMSAVAVLSANRLAYQGGGPSVTS